MSAWTSCLVVALAAMLAVANAQDSAAFATPAYILTKGQLAQYPNITIDMFALNATLNTTYGSLTTLSPLDWSNLFPVGMSFAILRFTPCSFLMPHSHPRGDEIEFSYKGSNMGAIQIPEGSTGPANMWSLPVGMLAIYPQSTVHSQINYGCDEGEIFVAFNALDPGLVFFPYSTLQLPFYMENDFFTTLGFNISGMSGAFKNASENYAMNGLYAQAALGFLPLPASMCNGGVACPARR